LEASGGGAPAGVVEGRLNVGFAGVVAVVPGVDAVLFPNRLAPWEAKRPPEVAGVVEAAGAVAGVAVVLCAWLVGFWPNRPPAPVLAGVPALAPPNMLPAGLLAPTAPPPKRPPPDEEAGAAAPPKRFPAGGAAAGVEVAGLAPNRLDAGVLWAAAPPKRPPDEGAGVAEPAAPGVWLVFACPKRPPAGVAEGVVLPAGAAFPKENFDAPLLFPNRPPAAGVVAPGVLEAAPDVGVGLKLKAMAARSVVSRECVLEKKICPTEASNQVVARWMFLDVCY
jgi:hypothetical protein